MDLWEKFTMMNKNPDSRIVVHSMAFKKLNSKTKIIFNLI